MRCPVCRTPQVIVEVENVELDTCIEGHGHWFDTDEVRQLFALVGVPEDLCDLESTLNVLPHPDRGERRRCPRCDRRMEAVAVPCPGEPIILDRCTHRHGIWFDRGELEAILSLRLGEDAPELAEVRRFLGHFERTAGEGPTG